MISLGIPGFGDLRLEHLVLDYNGTLAEDGILISGVRPLLGAVSELLEVHVITADTFGRAAEQLAGLHLRLIILPAGDQAEAKRRCVEELVADRVVAIGNGRNDQRMLDAAVLGLAVIQREGGAFAAIAAADIIVPGILDALELLRNPRRLTATLRS